MGRALGHYGNFPDGSRLSRTGGEDVELLHQTGLTPRGVVAMNHALGGDTVERPGGKQHRGASRFLIAGIDGELGFLDQGAGGRAVWPIAKSLAF